MLKKIVGNDIINKRGDGVLFEIRTICKLNLEVLSKEFGHINTDEVVITNERLKHIKDHHPEDYKYFEQYSVNTITNPDVIIKDCKNKGTVFMVKKLPNTNLNVVLRLSINGDDPKLKNSVMTFYRIRDKNLVKLEKKHKIIDRLDKKE